MEEQTVDRNDPQPRTEEVQAIIDRMPTYWVKWVVLCVVVLMGIILCLGLVIQYPDTVDGGITITSSSAPVRLVANGNARLHLLKKDASVLQKGQAIGYLDNGASYEDVRYLEKILRQGGLETISVAAFPDTLVLGEIGVYYDAFLASLSNYHVMSNTGIAKTLRHRSLQEVSAKRNALLSTLALWKERYVLTSPINGELEYLGFWKENVFVQAGEELFTVIPERKDVYGEAVIPAMGAGKVEAGQEVNIKLGKYPYDEYGLVRGKVRSVSRLTCKIQTEQGSMEAYQVVVDFPKGLMTNFGQVLPFDFETKGVAEIITKQKSLMERLFDNLKSKSIK
jgi:hypothetical protein